MGGEPPGRVSWPWIWKARRGKGETAGCNVMGFLDDSPKVGGKIPV